MKIIRDLPGNLDDKYAWNFDEYDNLEIEGQHQELMLQNGIRHPVFDQALKDAEDLDFSTVEVPGKLPMQTRKLWVTRVSGNVPLGQSVTIQLSNECWGIEVSCPDSLCIITNDNFYDASANNSLTIMQNVGVSSCYKGTNRFLKPIGWTQMTISTQVAAFVTVAMFTGSITNDQLINWL